jgi:hypothetical protein
MNEEDAKEFFEERAATREFMGGQSREDAEAAAREETAIHMFRCMIRELIRWKIAGRRDDIVRWLDKTDLTPPGREPAERKRYADALNEQLKLGNKGNAGEWK